MTNKLVVIINSLKVPKIKKLLLYEMKFLVPNYSCLQNPWLGSYRPKIPVLSVLSWICWTLPRRKFLGTPLHRVSPLARSRTNPFRPSFAQEADVLTNCNQFSHEAQSHCQSQCHDLYTPFNQVINPFTKCRRISSLFSQSIPSWVLTPSVSTTAWSPSLDPSIVNW